MHVLHLRQFLQQLLHQINTAIRMTLRECLNLNRINNKRECKEKLQINPEAFFG